MPGRRILNPGSRISYVQKKKGNPGNGGEGKRERSLASLSKKKQKNASAKRERKLVVLINEGGKGGKSVGSLTRRKKRSLGRNKMGKTVHGETIMTGFSREKRESPEMGRRSKKKGKSRSIFENARGRGLEGPASDDKGKEGEDIKFCYQQKKRSLLSCEGRVI